MNLTGVYARKVLDFPDQATLTRAIVITSLHPWTIANTADKAQEYSSLFGADELATLKASCPGAHYNMVASPNANWVTGGTWIPVPPKPEETLQTGMVWQMTPFGKRQVPVSQQTVQPPAAIAELSQDIKEELYAIVFNATTAALKAWSQS